MTHNNIQNVYNNYTHWCPKTHLSSSCHLQKNPDELQIEQQNNTESVHTLTKIFANTLTHNLTTHQSCILSIKTIYLELHILDVHIPSPTNKSMIVVKPHSNCMKVHQISLYHTPVTQSSSLMITAHNEPYLQQQCQHSIIVFIQLMQTQ